jgi:hypothetical protein
MARQWDHDCDCPYYVEPPQRRNNFKIVARGLERATIRMYGREWWDQVSEIARKAQEEKAKSSG